MVDLPVQQIGLIKWKAVRRFRNCQEAILPWTAIIQLPVGKFSKMISLSPERGPIKYADLFEPRHREPIRKSKDERFTTGRRRAHRFTLVSWQIGSVGTGGITGTAKFHRN